MVQASLRSKMIYSINKGVDKNMNAEELLKRYAAGERDFCGISLRRIHLSFGSLPFIETFNSPPLGLGT